MLDPSPVNKCPECPFNADCKDGRIFPEAGHVRMHDKSQVFVECFNMGACQVGGIGAAN